MSMEAFYFEKRKLNRYSTKLRYLTLFVTGYPDSHPIWLLLFMFDVMMPF